MLSRRVSAKRRPMTSSAKRGSCPDFASLNPGYNHSSNSGPQEVMEVNNPDRLAGVGDNERGDL